MDRQPDNLRQEGRNRAIDGILSSRCGERPTAAGQRALAALRRDAAGRWRVVNAAVRSWTGWAAAAAAIVAAVVLWRHDVPRPAPAPGVVHAAAPGIARIRDLSAPGLVTLRRAGTVMAAGAGTVLCDGDVVETGDGLARLQWFRRPCPSGGVPEVEATDFELEHRTVLMVSLAPDGAKRGRLDSGSLDCEVAPQPAGLPLTISTPHALVRVVGTAFTLQVAPVGTGLEVSKGRVDLVETARAAAIVVGAGQCATTQEGEKASVVPASEENPRPDPDLGLGAWEGDVERTLRSVPRLVLDGSRYRLRAHADAAGNVAGVLERIRSGEGTGRYRVTGIGPDERLELPGRRVHAWIDVLDLEWIGAAGTARPGHPATQAEANGGDRRRGGDRED